MRGMLGRLAAVVAVFATPILADLDPIVIKGSKFFYKTNGTQFFIQGVAYQQDAGANGATLSSSSSYTDPLADSARCQVDIPLLKQLNTNTIRVYAVDPTADHSACMALLQSNGIYVMLDLGQPLQSIVEDSPSWNNALYTRYTSVVDAFSGYSNVVGFLAGNEVSTRVNSTTAQAFVKAAVRDTKAYIKSKDYRAIPVGYAAADNADIRDDERAYLNCGDTASAIDFWGYNIYEWCGASSYVASGYAQRVEEFSTYSVPSFFAEYGCNTVSPRSFTEVGALFGSNMTAVFSGGFVYMYFEETNDYGLVDVRSGGVSKLAAFTAYSTQMASIKPTGVASASYSPTNSPSACPSVQAGVWLAASSPLPPTPNNNLCSCMVQGLSCTVKGSQANSTYTQLFSQVCGYNNGAACKGILSNGTTGSYGPYSVCSSQQQLSYAFDQYYKSQNSASSACNFGGAAQVVAASAASGTCSSLIASASSVAASGSSGSATASSTTSKAAANNVALPHLMGTGTGMFKLGLYVVSVFGLGAGLIVL